MDLVLLDTDILSEVLKQRHSQVVARAAAYLAQHSQFAISAFTRYEVVRGMREKLAVAQLQRFEAFCQASLVYPVTDAVLLRAADLWVLARRQGSSRTDADLIIAATAMESSRTLVTGNGAHFAWIPGLRIDDWRRPSSAGTWQT
jgi:predicted nucleic acid-binding protein